MDVAVSRLDTEGKIRETGSGGGMRDKASFEERVMVYGRRRPSRLPERSSRESRDLFTRHVLRVLQQPALSECCTSSSDES